METSKEEEKPSSSLDLLEITYAETLYERLMDNSVRELTDYYKLKKLKEYFPELGMEEPLEDLHSTMSVPGRSRKTPQIGLITKLDKVITAYKDFVQKGFHNQIQIHSDHYNLHSIFELIKNYQDRDQILNYLHQKNQHQHFSAQIRRIPSKSKKEVQKERIQKILTYTHYKKMIKIFGAENKRLDEENERLRQTIFHSEKKANDLVNSLPDLH